MRQQISARIPNLFDQYFQQENRVTNALLQTLATSRRLTGAFLRDFVGIRCLPRDVVEISSQKRPREKGDEGESEDQATGRNTLPDGLLVSEASGWAVVIESKIEEHAVRLDQLRGHLRAASHYPQRHLLVLTADRTTPPDVLRLCRQRPNVHWRSWTGVHQWVYRMVQREGVGSPSGLLLRNLKGYLEMDERLSDFQGIDFSEGYDLQRAKAILKNLMTLLRPHTQRLYPALHGGRGNLYVSQGAMWDCFGVEPRFTDDLHLTLSIRPQDFQLGLVVPNAARGRWRRLRRVMADAALQKELKGVLRHLRQVVPELWMRLDQRHFVNRREQIFDATFEFKVDTAEFVRARRGVKRFPVWFEMASQAVVRKRGINLQMGFWARFPYAKVPETRSPAFEDTLRSTLKQFKPLYQLLHEE